MAPPGFDKAGWPYVAAALAVAAAVGWMSRPLWAWPVAVLALLLLMFFRDPDRRPPEGANLVLAPADGRVLVAGAPDAEAAPAGRWQQVSIFLSPLDVHVNRIPVSGQVTRVEWRPGRFRPAYRADAGVVNERSEVWIEHAGETVIVRQIAGILARRVVCRVSPGVQVRAGDRFGIMKFGSRMDVFLPITAALTVHVGNRVRGGETVIANLRG